MKLGTYGNVIASDEQTREDTFDVTNPATEEVIATVAKATKSDVEAAISAADAASDSWAQFDSGKRVRLLLEIAERVEQSVDKLAETETLEMGRSLGASQAQAQKTARYFEYYAGIADKIEGQTIPISGNQSVLDYTVREPYGVTSHIIPWNASMVLAARSIAPALAAGNSVVAKADENAPLSLLTLGKIINETEIPSGVFNVVTGGGARTGQQLTDDDRVDYIEFTGSTETGTAVMKSAADHITPVHLELGGKSPNLVFPDADLEQAATDSAKVFWNTGQTCFSPTRIFVHEEVYEAFIDLLITEVQSMEIGPGMENNTIGPLITETAVERVQSYLDDAIEEGAKILLGGNRINRSGHFFEPTIVTNVDDDSAISCDEIFGPVVTVYKFSSESEALNRANATDYGLYALVWTDDLDRAHRLAGKLEAGTVVVNEYLFASPNAPSGGYKKSGIGRTKGQQAIKNYTQLKNVVISVDEQ